MKTRTLTILLTLGLCHVAFADDTWQVDYLAGLTAADSGNWVEAAAAFERAAAGNPVPEPGGIAYLPWIHLAVARFEAGDVRGARNALVQSHVRAVAPAVPEGAELIDRYGPLIMSAPAPAERLAQAPAPVPDAPDPAPAVAEGAAPASVDAEAAAPPDAVVSEPRDEVLDADYGTMRFASAPVMLPENQVDLADSEVAQIREKVLSECAECAGDAGVLPWYFHYQVGIDLLEAGDANRALKSFIRGANLRGDSRRDSRTYGMWFIDYLPYYQIAVAHARLGNWEEAQEALRLSARVGEFSPQDGDYARYSELEALVQSHVNTKDS